MSKRPGTSTAIHPARDEGWVATWRELGRLVWAILLIDLIAIGLGALAARPMGAFAHTVGVGIALFVTACFAVLIGGNLLVAWVVWLWRRERRARAGRAWPDGIHSA